MLKQRIWTAIAMAVVFLTVLFFAPPPLFILMMTVVVLVGAWEWSNLSGFLTLQSRAAYTVLVATVMAALWLCHTYFQPLPLQQIMVASGIWWAIALVWVQSYPSSALLWRSRWMRAALGLVVLIPAWISVVHLRSLSNGHWLVLAVIVLVAAADIGAYCAGRTFGRHKLAPAVSPGKTWEGVAGGVVAALLVAGLYLLLVGANFSWLPLLIAVPTVLVSVLGDLFESMLKRFRGVKDSSQLLPGHGGVLDRIDGLIAALPIFTLAILSSDWRIAGI